MEDIYIYEKHELRKVECDEEKPIETPKNKVVRKRKCFISRESFKKIIRKVKRKLKRNEK